MKIKKIQKKQNGKYEITLDDNLKIKTYDEIILNNDILFSKELNNEEIMKIDSENYYYDIYNKIVKMISNKLKSEHEIKDYLDKCDLTIKDKNKMLDTLKQKGLINDVTFTKAYIHDKISFSNYGPLKIKSELQKYGINDVIISECMEQVDRSIFDEKIEKYVLKKVNINHKYSKNMLLQKLKNELYLLGFDNVNIDDYVKDNNDILEKEIKKEYQKIKLKYSKIDVINKLYRKFYQKGFSRENITKCFENLDI